MSETADKKVRFEQLRERAEKIVKLSGQSVENVPRLVHELRVHQIEMEMQNEELRKAQKELEDSHSKYFSLFDFAPVGYFTLNQKNLIEEANLTGAGLLRIERSRLKWQRFTQYIVPDYQDAFYLHRKKVFDTNSRQTCELSFVRKDGSRFEAQLISVPCQSQDGSPGHLRIAITDISDHVKKVEDEVKAAKDLYQSLVENIDMGIVLLDVDYRIMMVNTTMSRWFNKSPRELIGRECFKMFEKRSAVCEHCPGKRAMVDGQSHIADTESIRDNGSCVSVQIHAFPMFDAEHKPKGFIEVMQDITDRKKAEEALRGSEERYHSLFENLLDGFAHCRMIFDDQDRPVDFIYLDVNDAFERLTRLKNVVGKKVTEVIPGIKESHRELFEIYGRVALTGKPEEIEIEFKPLNIWLSIKVYSIKRRYFITVFDNITERKKAEEALSESESRFRALFTHMVVGSSIDEIIYKDGKAIDYRILDVNPSYERIIGIPREKAVGALASELYGQGESPFLDIFSKVAETGMSHSFESYFPPAKKYLHITVSCPRKGRFSTVISDITERRKAEQKVQDYQKRLKSLASRLSLSKEHERRQIASKLHDNICQKLALSKADLQFAVKSVSDAGTLCSLTNVCAELDRVIEDIRLITFELGNPVLNELGLTAAIEKYLTEEIQEKHGIRFKLSSNLKNKEITETIQGCLYRDIRELLWNVIKHANAHQVKVLIRKSATRVYTSVEDDGVGFDAGRIALLSPGVGGFGLFSIREQLEYLGGSIRIKSNVGRGTKISMTLPLKLDESLHLPERKLF